MIIISHRGNLDGPNEETENTVAAIIEASKEYLVEVDIWKYGINWYLGHDGPDRNVGWDFISTYQDRLIFHAKSVEALHHLLEAGYHVFWHQHDDQTLTSRGWLWTYTGSSITPRSVCVLPEQNDMFTDNAFAVCTDFVESYK